MRNGNLGLICAAAVLMTAVSVSSFAQAQPGTPAPGGGRQGRGQGGGGQRGQGRAMTVATIPAAVLASELGLSSEQKTKVTALQTKLAADLKPLAPMPGQQVDQQTRQENGQKRQELNAQATKDIEAVLTDAQKSKLPDVIKSLGAYGAVGIPIGVLPDLSLTADQKTKIAAIGTTVTASQQAQREKFQAANGDQAQIQALMQEGQKTRTEAHDKAVALLTAPQKEKLDAYVKAHPAPTFGGGAGGNRPGGRRQGGAAPGGGAPPPASL